MELLEFSRDTALSYPIFHSDLRLHFLGSVLDRQNYIVVSRASADVASEAMAYLCFSWVWVLLEK